MMRSTIAGFAALLYFMIAAAVAKRWFPDAVASTGFDRDVTSTVVVGGTLATFTLVYWFYWKLLRLGRPSRSRRPIRRKRR